MPVIEVDMEKERLHPIFWIILVLLLAASVFVYMKGTEEGIGLVSDSVNYINGARSIAQGRGYFRESGGGTLKPITNFPPLYSIVLSIPMRFGMDGLTAAWWVSLIFFVLNICAVVFLVYEGSGCQWSGLLGGAVFLSLSPFLSYQFYAMSEPVYFFAILMAFLLFIRGSRSGKFLSWLGCGIACGCAFLARYIGAVSLCAIFGAIIVFIREKKLKALGGLFSGALPLMAAWLIRNKLVSGNASNRQVLSHWVTADDLKHGVMIFWRWIFPERYGNLEQPVNWMILATVGFLILAVIFLIVVMIRAFKGTDYAHPMRLFWTYLLFIPGYLAFVILTISLFDASVNIEERILFPAFMVGLLALLNEAGAFVRSKWKPVGYALLAVCVLSGVVSGIDTMKNIGSLSESGYGWGWSGWKDSPAMKRIAAFPEDIQIYSNQPEAVSLWAGRGAFALMDPIDPSSEMKREGYDETLQEIRRQVQDGESVLVFFGIGSWIDSDNGNWVTEMCDGLPVIYQDESEWIIGVE